MSKVSTDQTSTYIVVGLRGIEPTQPVISLFASPTFFFFLSFFSLSLCPSFFLSLALFDALSSIGIYRVSVY